MLALTGKGLSLHLAVLKPLLFLPLAARKPKISFPYGLPALTV